MDFHGVRARLEADRAEDLAELARDFAWFVRDPSGLQPHVALGVRARRPPRSLPAWTPLRWRAARIARCGGARLVDYEGRALLEYDLAAERGTLWCDDPHLRHELGYLAVLSRVGELLDRRGLHRVHALGFTYGGRAGLLVLPSGGGKSRLALELLRRPRFGLLSDDTPLLGHGGALAAPFPLRLSLRGEDWRGIPPEHLASFRRRRHGDKTLVSLDFFRHRVGPAAPLEWLIVGARAAGEPRPGGCSPARAAAALAASLVLGIGAPQVLELMLPQRPFAAGAWRLAAALASRAACAWRAATRARRALLALGPEAAANADALERLIA